MGDDVPLVGMVPEPAHVFDQLTRMVHQRIVDSNHASQAVTRLGIMLPPLQAAVVERLDVPRHLIQSMVQTGLVGGNHKLAVDPTDGLLFSNHQSREVFGKMAPFRFVGKQIAKDIHRVLHDGWKVHNGWHQAVPPPEQADLWGQMCATHYTPVSRVCKSSVLCDITMKPNARFQLLPGAEAK